MIASFLCKKYHQRLQLIAAFSVGGGWVVGTGSTELCNMQPRKTEQHNAHKFDDERDKV